MQSVCVQLVSKFYKSLNKLYHISYCSSVQHRTEECGILSLSFNPILSREHLSRTVFFRVLFFKKLREKIRRDAMKSIVMRIKSSNARHCVETITHTPSSTEQMYLSRSKKKSVKSLFQVNLKLTMFFSRYAIPGDFIAPFMDFNVCFSLNFVENV